VYSHSIVLDEASSSKVLDSESSEVTSLVSVVRIARSADRQPRKIEHSLDAHLGEIGLFRAPDEVVETKEESRSQGEGTSLEFTEGSAQ